MFAVDTVPICFVALIFRQLIVHPHRGMPAGLGLLPFWAVIAVLALAGLMRGLVNSARDISVRHVASSHSVGTVFAFVTTGFLVGQAFSPPLYGMLLDLGSPSIIFWVSGAFYAIGVGTIFLNRRLDRRAAVAAAGQPAE